MWSEKLESALSGFLVMMTRRVRSMAAACGSLVLCTLLLMLAGNVYAVEVPKAAPDPTALETDEVVPPADIVVYNRVIITLRAPAFSELPEVRARYAETRIKEVLKGGGGDRVEVKRIPQGQMVQLNGRLAFIITPGDVDPNTQETPIQAAAEAVKKLEIVIAETRESRSLDAILKDVALVLLGTAVFYALLRSVRWLRRYLLGWLARLASTEAERAKIGGVQIFRLRGVVTVFRGMLATLFWMFTAVLIYVWLAYTLSRFPYTRYWGETLNTFILKVLNGIGGAILGALPNLFVALVIVVLARLVVRMLHGFFDMVESRQIEVRVIDSDLATPTRRIANVIVWLFALAMAYPYLPVANTEAFKGVTLLFGLMLSLGASGLVGQAVSGLILTYARVLRPGEFIHIAGNEGTVTETGVFATRVRTGMGEELTLPNTFILSNVTRNYSRAVKGKGYIVDATVTIGYDTPWRQVHAMLIEAARRTPGVVENPLPRVYQIALSDFYTEYKRACHAGEEEPVPRAEVMSLLHANIQDVFNEYGVQIMSPHYFADPAAAKVVPKEHWHLAPADPDAPMGNIEVVGEKPKSR
ncbi:MAG TPA: mechanosensitive ion channel [Methylophilaceae bacterium]|nr:mechanosensitive ion channel [Methylophilaceae bacterium]